MRELIGITKHIVEPSFAAVALVDRLAFAVEHSGELVQMCLSIDAPNASQSRSAQCAITKASYQPLRQAQCSDLFLEQSVAGLWLLRTCRWLHSFCRNAYRHSRCCHVW